MGISSVEGGKATITATHAATGMSASIPVTATTLRDKFYLFQVTPAAETTLRYEDGTGAERTVKTNADGVLALYDPNGIASDVWLSSETADAEYIGTIYHYDLQSGERDATKLQLYPLNTFRLREAAKAELTLVKPDGSPLAGTQVTVRGGVFKNDNFCETAGLGTSRGSVGQAGAAQTDTTFTTDENGKITVYFDATQFWSAAAGETAGDAALSSLDKIQYALEIRNIVNDTYYPVFQMVSGTVSVQQEMRTASGVVVLETVPEGEANQPFVARQVVDYHLNDGALIDTRHSTGFVGPNYNFKESVLTTTMLLWGETGETDSYHLTMADENGYVPTAQSDSNSRYPFASMPVVENTLTLNEATMTTSGWIPDGKDIGLRTRLTKDNTLVQERTMPFRAIDLTRVTPVNEDTNVTGMLVTMQDASGWDTTSINFGNGGSNILNALVGDLGELAGPVDTSVFQMLITPSEDPTVFNALIWAGYDSLDLKDVEYKDGVAVSGNFMTKGVETDMPSVGDLQEMANGTYDPIGAYDPHRSNRLSDVAGFDFGFQLEGYYEAEIRYSRDTQKWEVFTKGGGFTAGVGVEFGFDVNTMAGPVPVTGSFETGGAIQLSFQAATRYSQQDGLAWSDPTASSVTDFLTNLRLRAYVEAFGGIGFDYSLIALKIGLFGKLDVNSENRFLSREYLADESKRQLDGQYLDIQSEVGIKFKAVFALISYEKVLASGSFGYGKKFNDWDSISTYWENTGTGLNTLSLRMAAQNGLQEVSSSATLQSRDYLEQYARSWGEPLRLFSLFSLDDPNGVANLQDNANPASFPELSDDGTVLAYISDSDSSSIYDSRAHFSTLNGSSYGQSHAFSNPSDGTGSFVGFGDSDVDIAGTQNFAAAAWVRMTAKIPEKDAGDDITSEEQNLLMNGTEIVASVSTNGTNWTSTRLTNNATPDLAPVVATNNNGKAIVVWRSVYSAAPGDKTLMDFSPRDQIMYSVFTAGKWSEAKVLYNGANGSVKALQAAILYDGTAMAVYTLDRTGASDGSGQEIGYTIVNSDGTLGPSMLATSDSNLDENPQVVAASLHTFDGSQAQRFILGWHSLRSDVSDIQLLAVDGKGVMSNTFPASLSALTSTGEANVGGDFRFARVWNSTTLGTGYVEDLTILWSETISDETTNGLMTAAHSELKATRLLADDTNNDKIVDSFCLTAPQVVAELPANTLLDHFDAYVETSYADNSWHPVKAVIQATYYDQDNPETIEGVQVPGEQTKLYTATKNFEPYGIAVESIGVDYENLMANSLTPIQFTIRNTGANEVIGLTVTMGSDETATLGKALKPNESATLTVYHKLGDTVTDASYTISGNSLQNVTGTVYLDYPDIGIARMEVLKEEEGKRTVSMTLYNASDASLAGKGRQVKLAFYTDNVLTEKANVTSTTAGVVTEGNTLTISGEADLKRIDAGSFTLEVTYDVGSYVKGQGLDEIPDSGVYLYADAWTEGAIGTQDGTKRLPEYHSSDNQAAVLLTGAYARTGTQFTLDVEQGTDGNGNSTADVTLRNNSLQSAETSPLLAVLLDREGNLLEEKTVAFDASPLAGETERSANVAFSRSGSRVAVYPPSNQDTLIFDGLPAQMDSFTYDEKTGTYQYTLSGVTIPGTLVTAYAADGGAVTINGQNLSSGGSQWVAFSAATNPISATIRGKTYVLTVNLASSLVTDAVSPNIQKEPQSASYTVGDTPAELTVTASVSDGGTLSYQWYRNTIDSTTGGTEISGATSKSYMPPTDQVGTVYYYCTVTNTNPNANGNKTAAATSATAKITITEPGQPEYTVTFNANGGTVEPASAQTTGGKLATLPVPTRSDYTFDGWFTAAEGGEQVTADTAFTQNSIIYAHWTYTGGSGGGESSTDTGTSTYRITVEPSANGTVKSSRATASVGSTVTLTAEPDSGYRLDTLTVTSGSGKEVKLTDKGNGSYTFTMPSGAVTVKASFAVLTADDLPFVDVPAGVWYEEGVRYAYAHSLMNGTSATTFSPDMTTSRAMIATILWRMEGSPVVDYFMTFNDVDPDSWYGQAVRWAASEGIVTGYGNNQFGPDDPITREQMAAMLYRYAQHKDYDVSVGENTNILSYTDFEQLGEWAVPAMQWACGAGIINGTGSGATLSPLGEATRAQAAVMLMRFCENYVTW